MDLNKGDTIPDGEYLYKYVKPDAFPSDQVDVPFTIFQDSNSKSLSCDWAAKQLYPDQSFHIKEGKSTIVRIFVCNEIKFPTNPKRQGQLVPDWQQEIIYDPIAIGEDERHPTIENPSHSLINGPKKTPVAKIIADNSEIWMRIDINEKQVLAETIDQQSLTQQEVDSIVNPIALITTTSDIMNKVEPPLSNSIASPPLETFTTKFAIALIAAFLVIAICIILILISPR